MQGARVPTLYQSHTNGIGGVHEHNRYLAAFTFDGPRGYGAKGQDDVWGERDQFRRVPAHQIVIDGRPAVLDAHTPTEGPTTFLQTLGECSDDRL